MSNLDGPVLIIDSQYDSRKVIKSTLHAIGHKDIKICSDADEGLELLNAYGEEYNLIITNVNSDDQQSVDLVNKIPLFLQKQSIFVHNEFDSGLINELNDEMPGLNTLRKPFARNELELLIEKVAQHKLNKSRAELLYKPLNQDSRILVVDDFETMRQLMRNAFVDLGYFNIDDAINGDEAYKLIRKAYQENDPYQLIFCDWNMPEKTGMELLLMLQKDHLLKGAPFIMVTAENEKNQVITAISAGVDDYIVKPLNPKSLVKKIEKINVNLKNKANDYDEVG